MRHMNVTHTLQLPSAAKWGVSSCFILCPGLRPQVMEAKPGEQPGVS